VWLRLGVSLLWLLLVCYPDPRVLWRSAANAIQPAVDPGAVREWAQSLPDDPTLIERAVLARIQYAIPWQKDGVPWTFPTPAEIMALGYGDCQGRAVVFASVLAAKGIPYQLRASVDHMWVDYRGKRANALENEAKTLWARSAAPRQAPAPASQPAPPQAPAQPAGGLAFRWPAVDLADSFRIEREYFWDAAPFERKLLLCLGLAVAWCWPRRPAYRDDPSVPRAGGGRWARLMGPWSRPLPVRVGWTAATAVTVVTRLDPRLRAR
jgi:hypothetical protein